MALKLRKDIKKSSYYVWFLGAKESKGLRGPEYILPVIKHLEEREKDVEPFKVTLQVSHKGLKIVQNVLSQGVKNNKPKNETIKHFIPHNTITCVYQHEDIIACILLLFNPVTKCPLHVHAYRCDSLETATLLKQQLQTLIERPENQKKFVEIENRLKPPKEVKKVDSSLGSDTGTSTRESESSEERFAVENTRVTTLYDSVAAELREKLAKNNVPILLPPRDYDTVHRQKGNLTGIELRRCLNSNIVGQNVKGRRIESSGGSSGIGSDHPPSPDSPDAPDTRFNTLDNHSTSDEDWNGDTTESTLYLMQDPSKVSLPRPIKNHEREKSPDRSKPFMSPDSRISRYAEPVSPKYIEKSTKEEEFSYKEREKSNDITKYLEKPIAKYSDNKYLERQKSLEREKHLEKQASFERNDTFERGKRILEKQKSVDLPDKYLERQKSLDKSKDKYYERSENYKSENRTDNNNRYYTNSRDKYDKYPEAERYDKYDRKYIKEEQRRNEKEKPVKYFEDDGFDEKIRRRHKSPDLERKYSYDSEEEKLRKYPDYPVPKTRQKYPTEDEKYYDDKKNKYRDSPKYYQENGKQRHENDRYYEEEVKPRPKSAHDKYSNFDRDHGFDRYEEMLRSKSSNDKYNKSKIEDRYYEEDKKARPKSAVDKYRDERNRTEDDFFEETVRRPVKYRQRSPSPENVNSPQDRFKDAKEKFLLMEKDRVEEQRRTRIEMPISPVVLREKPFLKRHESLMYPVAKDRYEDRYYEDNRHSESHPKPAPRHIKEEVRYRRDVPLERYRNTDKYDPKRRSMFSLIEEEHRKNSNEIAKELKRRSYMETTNYDQEDDYRDRSYQDLPESDRYTPEKHDRYGNYSKSSLEVDKVAEMKYDQKFIKNQQKISKNPAGFRHSYAESPKMRNSDKNGNKKHYPDMILQRTNSSVSNNNGRVGIASIHPY